MFEADLPDARLGRWLNRRGLRKNPFAIWNAERDPDLPAYFVDVGWFDELLRQVEPCVLYARRGCGKTAQSQMLAVQCRPMQPASSRLAIPYTYAGFERALVNAGDDVGQVRAIHHVAAILREGLAALLDAAIGESALRDALDQPKTARRLAAYFARFAPHLDHSITVEPLNALGGLTTVELLKDFADLLRSAGLEPLVVLVDGLDEFPMTAGDPARLAALLAPLLGTLPLLECPGMAFKLFLPQEMEPTLEICPWYRPDRLRVFRIAWHEDALKRLIGQRLTYVSMKGDRAYARLGQLCDDELANRIDDELARLANGLPRMALALADALLRAHCQALDPPQRIASATWEAVKASLSATDIALLHEQRFLQIQPQAPFFSETQTVPSSPAKPPLRVDEQTGCVWLGTQEVKKITKLEYRVLLCLYRNHGSICDQALLEKQAWQANPGTVSDETIAASIARLRRKLGQSSPHAGYIETVTGRGYRLHAEGFALS